MNFSLLWKYYGPFVKQFKNKHIIVLIVIAVVFFVKAVVHPVIIKNIIDAIGANQAPDQVWFWVWMMALSITIYTALFRISDWVMTTIDVKTIKLLQDDVLERLQKQGHDFYANNFIGSLVTQSKRYIRSFRVLFNSFIYVIWRNGIILIGSITVLFLESVTLGLIFIGWLVSYGLLVYFLVKLQQDKDRARAQAMSKSMAYFADLMTNIVTAIMFASHKSERSAYGEVTKNEEEKKDISWRYQQFWQPLWYGTSIGLFQIAVMSFAVYLWTIGDITVGAIVLVQIYVLSIFDIVWSIGQNIIKISSSISDAEEMIEIFEKTPDVLDPKDPEPANIKEGVIAFDNVEFGYPDKPAVFQDFNLTIKSGERVALVGHSGAGKTTVTKLLLRFMDIEKGSITIDGQNITSITQDDLRSHIAYVPQEPILFHRSLYDNIAYGDPTASKEQVIECAKQANAHEFITALPDGYDTLVGERGVKLSGGERQRVAIARAMLKDAPILLLDEATSALDSVTEQQIQQAFERLSQERTTLVIAHRLSTIVTMDRIIVIENGAIAEQGTHKELVSRNGIYADLWESQSQGFIGE